MNKYFCAIIKKNTLWNILLQNGIDSYYNLSYNNWDLNSTKWNIPFGTLISVANTKTYQWSKKSLLCDLEEKCLRNSKIFFDGVFLSIYLHLLKKLELSKLCKKKVTGL